MMRRAPSRGSAMKRMVQDCRLLLTMGDAAGIGPEIVARRCSRPAGVVVGDVA
jgi:hypothetical protein